MQGSNENAIAYLEHIDKVSGNQTTDDTILAKSLLHLGRLYFKAQTYELSHKYLNKYNINLIKEKKIFIINLKL